MSTKTPQKSYQDILTSISEIEDLTTGMNFESYCADKRTVYATYHLLLVIAEAAARLRGEPLAEQPWRSIRNMGNWIRHQYDALDLEIVWTTITKDLQPLREIVLQNLAALHSP